MGFTWLAPASAQERKPNIVIFLADDTGYGDPTCYGGKDLLTPNVDSIAKNGLRCTIGYVSCPYCSPTRAGLLTGRSASGTSSTRDRGA